MPYTTPGNPLDLVTPMPDDSIDFNVHAQDNNTDTVGGQVIAGTYHVRQVKYGGMGEVYLCGFKEDEAPRFALKTFQKQFFYEPLYRISFENEAVNWSRLSGMPHIMPVLGIEAFDGRVFLLLPCVNNKNKINSFRDELNDASCPMEKKLGHFFQCLIGFKHASKRFDGLVHGDIKPENMMIINNGIFITDFGLSKTAAELRNPQIKINVESTWAYMAPERWAGPGNETVQSDVYALGIVLYEILTGVRPFNAHNKAGWQLQHTQLAAANTQLAAPYQHLQPLLGIALQCLQKEPGQRPGLDELYRVFNEAWLAADVFAHLDVVIKQMDVMETFRKLQQMVKPAIISGLLKLQRPDLVLLEIENMDAATITPEIHYAKASSLSMVNRDEEAIVEFDAILAGKKISKSLRYDCLNELGLSYKRTKQFAKAERLYLDTLLPGATQAQVPGIMSNLSTVYLYNGDYDKGIFCLRDTLRDYPDSHACWANLGMLYFAKDDYENAASSLRKCLALKPGLADITITLAEVYLHMGLLDESYALLDSAWSQGHNTYRVLENMIMVCHFQNNNDMTRQLVALANREMGKEKAGAMLDRLSVTMKEIVDKYQASQKGKQAQEEQAAKPAVAAASLPKMDRKEDKSFTMPFLNTRLYEDDNSYSVDFYHDSNLAKEYTGFFVHSYNQSRHDPRMKAGNYRMRSTLFYFTECPHCHINILTNRDVGKQISCRKCSQSFATAVKTNPALDKLLVSCLQAVGLTAEKAEGQSILMLVQPHQGDDLDLLRRFFTEAGYRERKDTSSKQVQFLLVEMVKRNSFARNEAILAFDKDFSVALTGYAKQTPVEVDELVRNIRFVFRNLRSASSMYPTNSKDVGSLMMIGKFAEALAQLNEALQKEPDEFNLLSLKIVLCNELGRFAESVAIGKALVNKHPGVQKTWSLLGESMAKAGDYAGALVFLDKAIKMDPLDASSLVSLYKCYAQTGNKEGLSKIEMRLKTLGLI